MPRDQVCGNPLFLKWVEELRDAAREKGSKAYESYSKACRSLAACPVAYARPRELVVLQGIGEKTAGILESKWKKYCEENGLPAPGSPVKKTAVRKSKKAAANPDTDEGTHSEADDPAPPKKKRKPAKPKAYIPAKGSGGYGILVGLVLAIDSPETNTQVFLTKGELIRASQPYSDASYDHSEKGTYFTAWNSMKTLVNKGYVYVTGNPHKYCLTEEGYEVACAIRALEPELSHIRKYPFLHEPIEAIGRKSVTPLQHAPTPVPAVSSLDRKPSPAESSTTARRVSSGGKFQFWYIDSLGNRVDTLSSAMVRLDPVDFITLRKIELLRSQRDHPFARQLRLVGDSSRKETLFGFVDEETAPPTCSRFEKVEQPKPPKPPIVKLDTSGIVIISDGSDDDWVEPLIDITKIKKRQSDINLKAASVDLGRVEPAPAAKLASKAALRRANSDMPLAGPSRTPDPPIIARRPAPRLSSHVSIPHPLAGPSTIPDNLPDFEITQSIVYPAGTYEIVLVLDTREVESKTNRDRIGEKLLDKGVKMETRALRLGDVCWIARRLDGYGGEEDECVLDYVLERKRLDDLCSSIRDGRYHEQCFRLSNSGIGRVYYLVEDWQTSHLMEFSGQQIMTAKSQIQVHNKFFLKETKKLAETIDFLATMTSIIRDTHAKKDLHIIPTRYLSRSSFLPLKTHLKTAHPGTTFHTSFQAYQDLNDKSASVTLRDKFAKMLLCIKGMSPERVSAVIDEYETPRALWTALKAHAKEYAAREAREAAQEAEDLAMGKKVKYVKRKGADLFFADKIPGEGRRKIGDALSRDLYKVFMEEAPEED